MVSTAQPKISETPAYWTHGVDSYPGPVAVVRMAQLIDYDDRLYEAARIVYRFLIAYYHKEYGDALLSMRHVSKVMRTRAPEGAAVLSHSAVRRAIIALMETGWVVRTFKGRGKGKSASRYVPTLNVLDLASRGKFPELFHLNEPVEDENELLHANETVSEKAVHSNEAVDAEVLHPTETKTPILDPRTIDPRGSSNGNVSAPASPHGLTAAAGGDGFEKIWKAYGRLGNKVAAREAFAAIAEPDVEHIARRAASWAASAKPGKKRMPLEKWLVGEKYDEADRRPQAAGNDNTPAVSKPDFTVYPDRITTGTIERVEPVVSEDDGAQMMEVYYRTKEGELVEQLIVCESPDQREQNRGQEELQQLLRATDVNLETGEELVGRNVDLVITHYGQFVRCSAPFVSSPARPAPRFKDVVEKVPLGGWASKIGSAYANQDEAEA